MTMSRKGSRAITVSGHQLRFAVLRGKTGVRGCPDCARLHVIIADDSRKGSVVLVHVNDPSGVDVPITPRIIAAAAAQAFLGGWQPGTGSGVFLAISADKLPAS